MAPRDGEVGSKHATDTPARAIDVWDGLPRGGRFAFFEMASDRSIALSETVELTSLGNCMTCQSGSSRVDSP
jgi:hypothetical protein